jgi:hypothetical protein
VRIAQSGRHNSTSKAAREGLRIIEGRERRSAFVDAKLERSRADAHAGRAKSAEAAFDRLNVKNKERTQERGDL